MTGPNRQLVAFDVRRHLRRKSFWIASLTVPAFMILLGFLVQSSESAIRKSSDVSGLTSFAFHYADYSGLIDADLAMRVGGSIATDVDKAKEEVKIGKIQTLIVYPSDVARGKIQIFENNVGLVGDQKSTALARQLLQMSVARTVDSPQIVKSLTASVEVNRAGYRNGVPDPGLAAVAVPMLFLLVYFTMTIFLGNQIIGGFAEEREQKIREVLFVDVTASSVFLARMAATTVLGALQLAIMVIPIAMAYFAIGPSLGLPLPAFSTWVLDSSKMLVGFATLLLGVAMMIAVHAAVGAKIKSVREGSAFGTLFIIAMFSPSYILGVISENPGSLAVQTMTYFPLTAPSTLLFRNALGNISLLELIISMTVVAITSVVTTLAAIRIYRGGQALPNKSKPLNAGTGAGS